MQMKRQKSWLMVAVTQTSCNMLREYKTDGMAKILTTNNPFSCREREPADRQKDAMGNCQFHAHDHVPVNLAAEITPLGSVARTTPRLDECSFKNVQFEFSG